MVRNEYLPVIFSLYCSVGGQMGLFLCKFYNFMEEFNLTVSILLHVLMALERYVAIIHPFVARRLFTRCRMYSILVSNTHPSQAMDEQINQTLLSYLYLSTSANTVFLKFIPAFRSHTDGNNIEYIHRLFAVIICRVTTVLLFL